MRVSYIVFFHGLARCFLIHAKFIETINTYLKLRCFFFDFFGFLFLLSGPSDSSTIIIWCSIKLTTGGTMEFSIIVLRLHHVYNNNNIFIVRSNIFVSLISFQSIKNHSSRTPILKTVFLKYIVRLVVTCVFQV